jgi:hypothetical protein
MYLLLMSTLLPVSFVPPSSGNSMLGQGASFSRPVVFHVVREKLVLMLAQSIVSQMDPIQRAQARVVDEAAARWCAKLFAQVRESAGLQAHELTDIGLPFGPAKVSTAGNEPRGKGESCALWIVFFPLPSFPLSATLSLSLSIYLSLSLSLSPSLIHSSTPHEQHGKVLSAGGSQATEVVTAEEDGHAPDKKKQVRARTRYPTHAYNTHSTS